MNEIVFGMYADVRADSVFKKCFGSEQHKRATIGLINAMIPGINIKDVTFEPTELQGLSTEDRRGIIDVLCHSEDGSRFIVEMQRASHPYFRERTLYYSSLYLLNQAKVGNWDFHIRPSYVLAFIDFPLNKLGVDVSGKDIPMVQYTTTDTVTNEKMPGSAEYYFFDLESFIKKEEEIVNNQEKWLFLLRNSANLTEQPKNITGPEFDEFFLAATISKFKDDERIQYEKDMVTELDRKLSLQFAKQEGKNEGKAEGKAEGIAEGIAEGENTIIRQLIASGMSPAEISKITGITKERIVLLV